MVISLGCVRVGKVLLVDGDLWVLDVYFVFGMDNEFGLIDVLCGDLMVDECIWLVGEEEIDVLFVGKFNGDLLYFLIVGGWFEDVMWEICFRYDFVVIDMFFIFCMSELFYLIK